VRLRGGCLDRLAGGQIRAGMKADHSFDRCLVDVTMVWRTKPLSHAH
jgi:hypothetical protein